MAKGQRGRPIIRPKRGDRAQLSLKTTGTLKLRLEAEATRQGRTMSEEAEVRLLRSFDRDDLLGEVMAAAYGHQSAALLMVLGEALRTTAGIVNGLSAFPKIHPRVWDVHNTDYHDQWLAAPHAFAIAADAVTKVIDALRPSGNDALPQSPEGAQFTWTEVSDYAVAGALRSLVSSSDSHWQGVRADLGDLAPSKSKKGSS